MTDSKPVIRCFGFDPSRPCGEVLHINGDGEVVCTKEGCGRRYNGSDLIRLQVYAARSGRAE